MKRGGKSRGGGSGHSCSGKESGQKTNSISPGTGDEPHEPSSNTSSQYQESVGVPQEDTLTPVPSVTTSSASPASEYTHGRPPLSPTSCVEGRRSSSPRGSENQIKPSVPSPILTPACELDENDFDSLFHHISHPTKAQFFEQMNGRRTDATQQYAHSLIDDAQAQASYKATLKKSSAERVLQEFVMTRLNTIKNVSTSDLLRVRNKNNEKDAGGPEKKRKVEAQLKTIMEEYTTKVSPPIRGWNQYPPDPRGNLVTSSSLSDISCFNSKSKRIFHGEIKVKKNYSIKDGIRQCAGYLWHQLWWFRTVQRLGVEQVYGFTICGPHCKDTKDKVVVSLLMLSQCTKIGGKFKLHEYRKSYDKDNDFTALDLLRSFVDTHFTELPTSANTIRYENCPGIMMVPQELLDVNTNIKPPPWEIVISGTAALIFRVEARKGNETYMKSFLEKLAMSEDNYLGFMDSLEEIGERDGSEYTFYLKIKNRATRIEYARSDLYKTVNRAKWKQYQGIKYAQEWLNIYTSKPSFACEGGIIFLMSDCGSELKTNDLNYDEFCREFLSLMKSTMLIQEKLELVHGDIHQGNLLFDKDADELHKLRLIDWDEAWDEPQKRQVKTEEHEERYPDLLLKEKEAYTKTQLILLFRDISKHLYGKDIFEHGGEIVFGTNHNSERLLLLNRDKTFVNLHYELLEKALLRCQDDPHLEQKLNELTTSTVIQPNRKYNGISWRCC